MPQKNRYLRHARVSGVKLRQALKYFCADLTAVQAAELGGLNRETVLRLHTLFRERMALLAADECPFAGEVEVDESYFGANRVRRLTIRYERRADIHEAFATLGCALICLNQIHRFR